MLQKLISTKTAHLCILACSKQMSTGRFFGRRCPSPYEYTNSEYRHGHMTDSLKWAKSLPSVTDSKPCSEIVLSSHHKELR